MPVFFEILCDPFFSPLWAKDVSCFVFSFHFYIPVCLPLVDDLKRQCHEMDIFEGLNISTFCVYADGFQLFTTYTIISFYLIFKMLTETSDGQTP